MPEALTVKDVWGDPFRLMMYGGDPFRLMMYGADLFRPGVFNQGSVARAYVDQLTIDFFYFYKYTWARRHIYV